MAWVGGLLCACLSLCFLPSLGVPPQHRGWLRLWEEGEDCGECNRNRCPEGPPNCPAGLVKDGCGCCENCGNAEGQPCDLDGAQTFYGQCGEGLSCQKQKRKGRRARTDDPEPKCVCQSQEPVCGSDKHTYPNLCHLQEAANQKDPTLRFTAKGPCYSVPRIYRAPKNITDHTGKDIIFSCEVSAFPLPNLNWKKEGSDNFLPGDDPHISVQARGGPERYAASTWLQIEGLRLSDAGVYSCISHNALGETSASARLTVLREVMTLHDGQLKQEEVYFSDDREESGEDSDTESGDSNG